MHAEINLLTSKGRSYSGGLSVDVRIILKSILKKCDLRALSAFIWLKIGITGEQANKFCST
jgi:hypothetical protein